MLTDLIATLESMIPLLKEKRQAEELALEAEAIARHLSGLPPITVDEKDLITVLQSVCLLLERFLDRPELLNKQQAPSFEPEQVKTSPIQDTPVQKESLSTLEIVPKDSKPKPSKTANALIRLRDWILLARSSQEKDNLSPEILNAIYTQLGQILENEGIMSLEDTGMFDYERHQIISTQATDDPEKEDLICNTVRPGYLFDGSLIRPQEVIIYKL